MSEKNKKENIKGEYCGYQLAVWFRSLEDRREFEQAIDDALNSVTNHGKINYWGGTTGEQTEEFIKNWFE